MIICIAEFTSIYFSFINLKCYIVNLFLKKFVYKSEQCGIGKIMIKLNNNLYKKGDN